MRMVLVVLLFCLALAAACGGGEATHSSPSASLTASPSPSAPPTASPSPSASPAPTPEPTPAPPPAIDLDLSQARQGGFIVARLLQPPDGLSGATVAFNGGTYTMLPEAGRWFAIIGLGTSFGVGSYPIEADGPDGGVLAAGAITVGDGGFQYESFDVPPSSSDLLQDPQAVADERALLAQVYANFTAQKLWSGAWTIPAAGTFSDGYGLMRSINGAPYYPHTGTDIANVTGTPVAAAASGVVALAQKMYLFGNVVAIDHGAGVYSSYNHLDSMVVQPGQAVTQGQLIGYMGETGFVSGPHLHWEAVVHGVRVDATLFTQEAVDP